MKLLHSSANNDDMQGMRGAGASSSQQEDDADEEDEEVEEIDDGQDEDEEEDDGDYGDDNLDDGNIDHQKEVWKWKEKLSKRENIGSPHLYFNLYGPVGANPYKPRAKFRTCDFLSRDSLAFNAHCSSFIT